MTLAMRRLNAVITRKEDTNGSRDRLAGTQEDTGDKRPYSKILTAVNYCLQRVPKPLKML